MRGNQSYINGIRAKSFPVTTIVGVLDVNLSLSGLARCFNGLIIQGGANLASAQISLIINNDQVIENASAEFFAKDVANPRQYFEFYRALEGNDTITLRIQDSAAQSLEVLVYYQNQ